MIYYYRMEKQVLGSLKPLPGFLEISPEEAERSPGLLAFLVQRDPSVSRRSFALTHSGLLQLPGEGLDLLLQHRQPGPDLPDWILKKMASGSVMAVNSAYPGWEKALPVPRPQKWRINLAGLGDVGGTLLTGLRLLGGGLVSRIGIFDLDGAKVKRWEFEINQIRSAFGAGDYPEVDPLREEEIFDCDLFVFCVSVGVPPIGAEGQDVRLAQLAGNGKVVSAYAANARRAGFQGIFAVVSDPVDHLCRIALEVANRDGSGGTDHLGLAPEQIRGYGLGVMNARAVYYARQDPRLAHFEREGRAYGPHGQGLVIADSVSLYRDDLSRELTDKVEKANLEVRATGYKPYVAPALSSGALSLLATIRGEWHYSATFMGGVFMGAKNRLTPAGVEIEQLALAPELISRLQASYDRLWPQPS